MYWSKLKGLYVARKPAVGGLGTSVTDENKDHTAYNRNSNTLKQKYNEIPS